MRYTANIGPGALQLARLGMAVFPCWPHDKRPVTPHGHLDATTDQEQIKAWWKENCDYNVAIATGDRSGVFIVDLDDESGASEFYKMGVLPHTVEAVTGRGTHIYLKMPGFDLRSSVGTLAPHVDVRANGGYAIAPPSLHPCGKRYRWSEEGARTVAPAPQWLIDKLTNQPARTGRSHSAFLRDIYEGERNRHLASFAGYLLRSRPSTEITTALLQAWNQRHCIPPLDEDEVKQIVNSIGETHARNKERGQ